MSKLILGLIISVLLALAVTAMLDKSSRRQEITQPDSAEAPAGLTTRKQFANADGSTEEEFGEWPDRRSVATARMGMGEPAMMPDQQALESPQIVSPEFNDPQSSSEPEPTASPDGTDYTLEVAEMLGLSMPKNLRERHDSEERDDSWAAHTEERLLAYFDQSQALSQFYVSLVDCRTSICEIHALGYGPDDRAVWHTAAHDIIDQPWHDLHRFFTHTVDVQRGITGNVLIIGKDRY
jgi:hypothetical protein